MEQLQYFTPGDSFRSGYDRGREQARANRLRELTSAYLAAPQEQRQGFASQFAALDHDAGLQIQALESERQQAAMTAQQSEQEKRRIGAGKFAQYLTGIRDPARRQQIAGMYSSQFGDQFPQDLSDEGLGAFAAMTGEGAEQGAQSAQRAYVEWMAQQVPEEERGEFFRVQAGLAPKAQNQRYSVQGTEMADGTVRYEQIPTIGGNVAGGSPTPALPYRVNLQGLAPESVQAARFNIEADMGRPTSDAEWAQISGQRPATSAGLPMAPAPVGQATNATRAAAAAQAEAEKVRAAELARGDVAKINDAPKVIQQGEMLIANIDALLDDPNLSLATGASGVLDPRSWPIINRASGVADTNARIDQIQGSAFLQAFESLKGGGAITEVEGKKAEQAIARLTSAQSDEGFKAALRDFRAAIAPGIERARARLAGGSQSRPKATDGAGRTVEWDGSNWVEVR